MARTTSARDPRARFALRRAVRRGSTDEVGALLDAGFDPNDPSGPVSIVALAAEIGSAEIAELLVAHGADPAWVSRDGWSAATFADANDFTELAERLVELGAPVESRLAHGYSHLHRAARRGDAGASLAALGPGQINVIDAGGATPLLLAVTWRQEAAFDALLSAGATPDFSDDGWSVLAEAAYQDSRPDEPTQFVSRLLAAGANPNPRGYPPLFCAVNQEWSSGSVLQQLVSVGANIATVWGPERDTVLHRIAWMGDADLVDAALEVGAEIEARNAEGRTPMLVAASAANAETFIRLVERGADLSALDGEGLAVGDLVDPSADADEIRAFIVGPNPAPDGSRQP